jgi:hypothetical protein
MHGTTSTSVRGWNSTNRSEIDLRAEFDTLIYGDGSSIPHGHLIVIRNMRRDADGRPTKCSCFEAANTTEADPDCSYCLGEGYLWDEQWAIAYSMVLDSGSQAAKKYVHMVPGMEHTDYTVFFIRYDNSIRYEDKIVEMRLDTEGQPVLPYVRDTIYKPHTIKRMRSDYGRVEFIAVFCREEDAWRSDY